MTPRRSTLAATLVIVIYFLLLAHPNRALYFNRDSVLAIAFLHGYGQVPWGVQLVKALTVFTGEYRPMAGLYLRTLFAIFGLNPVAFRVAAVLVLLCNLALAARWFRLLSQSGFTAAAAALLFAFHPRLAEIYYADGAIYDVLCLFFFLLALGCYTHIRQDGRVLSTRDLLVVAAFYGAALGSKEMAVTLPAVLILYEGIFHPRFRDLRRRGLPILVLALMTALCLVWKVLIPNPMSSNVNQGYAPHYQPSFIAQQYLEHFRAIFQFDGLSGPVLGAALLFALLLALVLRDRVMAFGLLFTVLTLAPVCLVREVAGAVIYLPLLGMALYGGSFLSRLCGLLKARAPGSRAPVAVPIVIFGLLAIALYAGQASRAASLSAPYLPEQQALRALADAARAASSTLPPGSRILLENAPDEPASWMPLFLLRLAYRNPTLWVDLFPQGAAAPIDTSLYRMRIHWDGSQYHAALQPQSDQPPVLLEASPSLVHRGFPIHVQFPASYAGCPVDAAYRMPEDELLRAGVWSSWMTPGADGQGTAIVLADAERGPVVVDRIRVCRREWLPAHATFVIIP